MRLTLISESRTAVTPASTHLAPAVNLTEGVRDPGNYLHELECLMGLAILLVFLFHAWGISGLQWPTQPAPGLAFIAAGNTGVTLFFVLSGFLLSLPWLRYWLDPGQRKPSVRQYLKARAMRILPLYYCALAVTWLATGNTAVVAQAAVFQFVGFSAFPYSVVWWTLVTEVQFYLLLPLLMSLWISGRRGRWICMALLLAWAWAYLELVLRASPAVPGSTFFLTKSVFARLPAFMLGVFAAAFYLRASRWECVNRQANVWRYGGLLLTLASLLLLEHVLNRAATMGDLQAELEWHLHHSWEAALWAVMMLCLLLCRLPGAQLLINPGMAVIGKLSYSLYLIHVPILFYLLYPLREQIGVDQLHNSWWFYTISAAALLLSVLLSWGSYTLIERPFLRMKRGLAT
jgi:peptidoglycan/LPS O-acetylase OafA/YrhL